MSDFPDPEEEFELMYGDEFDLLRGQDDEDENLDIGPPSKVRRSLNFSSANAALNLQNDNVDSEVINNQDDSVILSHGELQIRDTESEIAGNSPTNKTSERNYKKRTVDSLLNDKDSNYLTENLSAPKKRKVDEKLEQDLQLIDIILQKRAEYRKKNNITSVSINESQVLKNLTRNKHNLSYSVPKYPFIKLKSFSGESVYVRCHSEEYEKEDSKRILQDNSFKGVMGDNFKSVWEEAQKILTSDRSADDIPGTEGISLIEPDNQEKQLWVDLYKPTKYIELLSDESTNRTTLRWIKLWDKVVFNKNPKIKVALQKPDGKMNAFRFNELNTDLDEFGRPHHKVVLLCGPPGLGKTTLAHMVAKHAGYRVVEINASDDRTIDAFRTALENATQMRSVIDEQKRPNCIVFDEIDGAPQASIDFLVKFITGTAAVKGKKSKAKDKEHHILKRPIICICNDVYVPALRPLRQIAFVINFPQTSSARLAERLMEIAKRQNIKTDLGAMMALAEKSNNDVRTCISVLHFYKAQNKQIGLTDIYKVNVGQKDMQKGLFSVWNDIFEIKRVRKHEGGTTIASAKERTQNILNTMSSFGDHERVAQGIYENFPRLKIKDPGLNGTSCALDWFCYNDMITKQIHEIHNYSLMNYLNYAFVVWHFVFGSFQRAKLTYPSMGYEMRIKETRQKALVAEVLRGMTSSVRCYHSALPLVLDVFPLLLRIIAPSFKPVNVHLYTEEDRRELLRVASVMTDYNLNYIQERKADGVYEFILEPNIEELVTFGKSKTTIRKLTYSNRQLVAREIEVEKLRRFESIMQKKSDVHTTEKPVVRKQSKAREDDNPKATVQTDISLPNHLQTLQYKALDSSLKSTKTAVRKDFFGRIFQTTRASSGKGTRDALSNDIWFLYKEGYSNAVKKRVKVKDLK